jgi:hypothetical protein
MYNNSFLENSGSCKCCFLYSCDKDYNEIGGDLIGENNFGLEKQTYMFFSFREQVHTIQQS